MSLDLTHPSVADLRRRARRRIPHFAFEYLDSATGRELGPQYNRTALDAIRFMPAILHGRITAGAGPARRGDQGALWGCPDP